MNALNRFIAKWESPLILSAWAMAFLCMLDRSRYKLFLRPEFGFLVAIGLFSLLAMLFAFTLKDSHEDGHAHACSSLNRILRIFAMTIPLWFMLGAQGAQLDADAYKRRATTPIAQTQAVPSTDPVLVAASPADAAATTQTEQEIKSKGPGFLEMVVDPRAFDGQHVSAEGMVCYDPTVTKLFGAESFLLFRFAITCCAADARPVAILAKPQKPVSFKESSWVRVEGELSAKKMEDKSIVPLINDAKCESIKAPDEPYVYP